MKYKIVDSPSNPNKLDLAVSLFQGNSEHRQTVRFTLIPVDFLDSGDKKLHLDFFLNRIERDDGSAEEWIICGMRDGKPMKAFYDTQTRTGRLEILT